MAQDFTLFRELPPELQQLIWEFSTCLQPRIIEVRFAGEQLGTRHDFVADIPSILHTCRESRRAALKVYKQSFGTRNATNTVYFNADIDTLLMREPTNPYTLLWASQATEFLKRLPDKQNIRRIMMTLETAFDLSRMINNRNVPLIFEFPNLEEVAFIKEVRFHDIRPCGGCARQFVQRNPYYWLRSDRNLGTAPVSNRTLVISEEDLARFENESHPSCCDDSNVACQVAISRRYIEFMNAFRDEGTDEAIKWKEPSFHYKGVSFDRIPRDKFCCN